MAGLYVNSVCLIALLSHLCALTAFGQGFLNDDVYDYYDYVEITGRPDTDLNLDDWLYDLLDFTDPCASNPCLNGGSCGTDASGGFTCLCPEPYTGKWCQKVKDVCKNVKCGNGDCLLTSTAPFYQCKCRTPFKPPDCKRASSCRPNPCQNGGSCTMGAKRSTFQCSCSVGYSGKYCDVGPNDCYQGDGEFYRGMVSETEEGEVCLDWDSFSIAQNGESPFISFAGFDGIGQHNYCRNPDGDDRPWCYIKKNGTLDWDHCKVRKCTAAPTTPPTTHETKPTVTPATQFSECGKPQPRRLSRIIGGKKSVPGAHPWQVSVQVRHRGSADPFGHFCGGILLGSCWVLTAAHCIESEMEIQVVLGRVNIEKDEEYDQVIPVERAIVHEKYRATESALYNDIALLQLRVTQSPYCAKETRFVKAACLPKQPFNSGTECVTSGWGATETKAYSKHLLNTRILLISKEKCKAPHVYGNLLDDSMLCAGIMRGGSDSCQGDSGGPLVCARDGTHHIVGVVSWGHGCGDKNKPGVYADVGHFADWIARYVR